MDNLTKMSTLKSLRKALENLPNGFEATYDITMARIDEQSPEHRKLAYQVLSWISYAFRPLLLIELQYAIAVQQDMTDLDQEEINDGQFLLSLCGGLVIINHESEQVALVREYAIYI